MTDWPIRNTPQSLYPGGYNGPLSVYNRDPTNTVYLGESTSRCQQGQGLPLGPRSSVPWDANRPLWAVAPNATPAAPLTLSVVENQGAIFSPGDIASQIIGQGLANQIAAAIYISGAPPVDQISLINNTTIPAIGAQTPMMDVSSFQSLKIVMQPSTVSGFMFTLVQYFDPTQSFIVGYQEFYSSASASNANTIVSLPVLGPVVRVTYNIITGSSIVPASAQMFGSFKAVNKISYFALGVPPLGTVDGDGINGASTWSGAIPAATTWTWQPGVTAGKNQLTLRWVGAGTISILVRVPTAIFGLTTYYATLPSAAVTAGQTDVVMLDLPAMPVEISLQNNHATIAQTFRISLVSEGLYT